MKVFCWDFDGTITHSKSLWSRSVFEALKSVMPQIEDSLFPRIRAHMQSGFPWDTPDDDDCCCKDDAWWEFMEKHFTKSYIKCGIVPRIAEIASKKVHSLIRQPSRYTLYHDAVETLQEARARGAVNLLLSNNYPDLDEVIEELGLTPYFDDMIISGKVGYNKPRREIFELAKQKFPNAEYSVKNKLDSSFFTRQFVSEQKAKTELQSEHSSLWMADEKLHTQLSHRPFATSRSEMEIYMIGDNLTADILGGKQSGMTTVLVHKGFSDQADYCFDNLISVLSLI